MLKGVGGRVEGCSRRWGREVWCGCVRGNSEDVSMNMSENVAGGVFEEICIRGRMRERVSDSVRPSVRHKQWFRLTR